MCLECVLLSHLVLVMTSEGLNSCEFGNPELHALLFSLCSPRPYGSSEVLAMVKINISVY